MTTLRSITGAALEDDAVAEKINLLTNVLEQHAMNSGLHPYNDAERIAEYAASLTQKQWTGFCYYAGCGLPSEDRVVAGIVRIFMRRADVAPAKKRAAS